MKKTAAAELAWLVDDLVIRIPQAQQAILLSADGLLMAASATLGTGTTPNTCRR